MANSKEYYRLYMLRRYHARMAEARKRLGDRCSECGDTVGPFEIDHIDPSKKCFTLAKGSSFSKSRWDAELAKCQLLCRDCHGRKTLVQTGKTNAKGTHGTLSAIRYCRPACTACRKAKAEYAASRRQKQSASPVTGR